MRNFKQQLSISRLLLIGSLAVFIFTPLRSEARTESKLVGQRTRLNDDVLRLSQPAKCKVDSDCAALPMGIKPCGGPWKYILYSKKNAKLSKLKKRLDEYNKLDQQINETQQTMSDCSVTMKPELKCTNSMCVDSKNTNAPNAGAGLGKMSPESSAHAPPPD
jgi:hypothetical protein